MKKWKVDYEPKGMFDRGDIYTLEIDGKKVAKFSNNGGWGRGIQLADKEGELVYTRSISGHFSLEETQEAIEERLSKQCPKCNGLGKWGERIENTDDWFKNGSKEIICKECHGSGVDPKIEDHTPKPQKPTKQCSKCNGHKTIKGQHLHFVKGLGVTNMYACPQCNGTGSE